MGTTFCSCVAVTVEGGFGLMAVLLLVSPFSFLFVMAFYEIGESRPMEVDGYDVWIFGEGCDAIIVFG